MFRYRENQMVVLTANYEAVGLLPGDKGVVWALYDTVPPSYEVTFHLADGTERDVTVSENEIAPFAEPKTAQFSRPALAGVAAT